MREPITFYQFVDEVLTRAKIDIKGLDFETKEEKLHELSRSMDSADWYYRFVVHFIVETGDKLVPKDDLADNPAYAQLLRVTCADNWNKYGRLIREVAFSMGYAIGQHGSMARDIDLIAVPWTESARPGRELIDSIALMVRGFVRPDNGPTIKPHGRLAWSVHFYDGTYLDISVMPRMIRE